VPKHLRKFLTLTPASAIARERKFTISKTDWLRIENAYGRPLPEAVRQAVEHATQDFVCWDMAEQEARPIADAMRLVETYKKATGNFQRMLDTESESMSDAEADTAMFVQRLISRNFRNIDPRRSRGNPFDLLRDVFTELDSACERALGKLSPMPKIITLGEGQVWRWWIRDLSKIMKDNSLPASVRKDSDKSTKLSPFLVFVRELQKCLPKECNFPAHSDRALAEAIVRARRGRFGAQSSRPAT
jgi:hypothetical protein